VSDTDQTVSPSRLATYVECPRRYEYQYDQRIEPLPDGERYKNRGIVYHQTIASVCNETDEEKGEAEIYERARKCFKESWSRECSPDDYKTRSHYEYDRKLTRTGIETYFENGPGIKHARNSVGTEITVETEYKRTNVSGRVDNVVRTDEGLLLVDYKGSLSNIITGRTVEKLKEHLENKTYRPKLVKSAIQAAVYLEGIRETDLFEEGMNVSFLYYGILHDHEPVSTNKGIVPDVSGSGRDVTNLCMDNHGTIWQLIREAYQGILTWDFEPNPWSDIYQSACGDCPYMEMCPDYLGEEVKIE